MVIKTLSIPQDLNDFLLKNEDLSPSKMLQSKIIEIRENRRLRFAEMDRLKKHNVFLAKKLEESGDRVAELEVLVTKLENDLAKA